MQLICHSFPYSPPVLKNWTTTNHTWIDRNADKTAVQENDSFASSDPASSLIAEVRAFFSPMVRYLVCSGFRGRRKNDKKPHRTVKIPSLCYTTLLGLVVKSSDQLFVKSSAVWWRPIWGDQRYGKGIIEDKWRSEMQAKLRMGMEMRMEMNSSRKMTG